MFNWDNYVPKIWQKLNNLPLHQVSSLLQASSTWAQYESQKHDLFIEDKPVAGYLTSQPQTAGYLTMSRSAMPSVPPPIEANESSDNQDLLM